MYKYGFKRLIDIVICILAFPLFAIFFILVGIAIKLEDRGPVFYCGERLGKDGKVFRMFKFRSMKIDAPDIRNQDGTTYNAKDDPRVTRVGRFIRETSIDEIPQILNVLRGDMSIIGPRPSLPDMLNEYTPDELPKLNVRPGITGYCQAYYRNSMPGREKRLVDAWYANNLNFWLDIRIFYKTIVAVVKRESLYTNTMYDSISKPNIQQ